MVNKDTDSTSTLYVVTRSFLHKYTKEEIIKNLVLTSDVFKEIFTEPNICGIINHE